MTFIKNGLKKIARYINRKKILYLVLHTKLQSDRYKNVMRTWGKNQNIIFYSDHQFEGKIIKVSDNNTRSSGEEKQLNIINNLPKQLWNYDWFVFVDNDTFVNTKKLESEIGDFEEDKVHGHLWNCWPGDKKFFYCLGGAGIFISKKILFQIKGKLTKNNVIWSDVSLGLNLRRLGVEMVNSIFLHPQMPEYHNIKNEEIKNHITFHYVTSYKDMRDFSKLCGLIKEKEKETKSLRVIKCN